MKKNRKLESYDKLVELAQKELILMNNAKNIRRGIFNEQLLKKKAIVALVDKYRLILNVDELNIFELNLYVKESSAFLESLNNLAQTMYKAHDFRALLKSGESSKLNNIIAKLAEYYNLDRELIVRKIKEVLTYETEVIVHQKRKLK